MKDAIFIMLKVSDIQGNQVNLHHDTEVLMHNSIILIPKKLDNLFSANVF